MFVCLGSPSDTSLEIGCANHADSAEGTALSSAGNIHPSLLDLSHANNITVLQENIELPGRRDGDSANRPGSVGKIHSKRRA